MFPGRITPRLSKENDSLSISQAALFRGEIFWHKILRMQITPPPPPGETPTDFAPMVQ